MSSAAATINEVLDDDHSLESFVKLSISLDGRQRGLDVAGLRRWDAMTGRHLRLVASVGDEEVAVAEVAGAYNDPASMILPALVVVRTDHRGRGIGSALFVRLSEWARDERRDPTMMLVIPEEDHRSVQHWVRRGFATVERFSIVALDLLATAPAPMSPSLDGIELVSLAERPDLVRAAWQLEVDAGKDMPGQDQVPPPFEVWEASMREGRRPMAGCFVAVDGAGSVVGITTIAVSQGDVEQAHNRFTGVAAGLRGRGVALALKLRQVEWCRVTGYHVLETANHEDNAPMRAINEKLGYRPKPAQLVMHGAPATGAS